MTPEKGVRLSIHSVDICERLNMTGRVFSTQFHALSMMEGPTEVMRQYFEALGNKTPHIDTIVLQSARDIEAREFDDYSVWLDLDIDFAPHPGVHPMTLSSLRQAMPAAPSIRLQIMMDAFFEKGRLVS
jgi:hypothetical protein